MSGAPIRPNGPQYSRLLVYAALAIGVTTVGILCRRTWPGAALHAILVGAVGDSRSGHLYAISESLVSACPLLLTGLGVVVAWRAGMFSIGAEGQLLMGALAAIATAGLARNMPGPVLTLLMILAGSAAGAGWSALAGWLRVRRGVPEVISTIMLNYVALYLVGLLVEGPLQESGQLAQTAPVPAAAMFARLLPASWTGGVPARLHSGVLLALLAAAACYVYLYITPEGLRLRVLGSNPEAARTAGFAVDRIRVRAMALSGALCGLAGAIELAGVAGRLYPEFSPGWGYSAIPVALIGGLHPIGTALSALFFGGLAAGCGNLERMTGVSAVLINVIQAAAVLAVIGVRAWRNRSAGAETV
jgi:simple sugar transport system permease protein